MAENGIPATQLDEPVKLTAKQVAIRSTKSLPDLCFSLVMRLMRISCSLMHPMEAVNLVLQSSTYNIRAWFSMDFKSNELWTWSKGYVLRRITPDSHDSDKPLADGPS